MTPLHQEHEVLSVNAALPQPPSKISARNLNFY